MSTLIAKAVFSTVVLLAVALQVTRAQAAPDAYAAAVLKDGPIGYWRLNEDLVQTPAKDSSLGGGNDGKYSATGITLRQPGFHGGDTAALFDGLDGRIVVPNSLSLNPKNITIEAKVSWSGPNPGPTQYEQRILEKSYFIDPTQQQAQYGLTIADGHVQVQIRTGQGSSVDPICNIPGNVICAKSIALVPPGVETHVVATYDGKAIGIYLNGIQDSTTPGGDRVGDIEPVPPGKPCDPCNLGIGNQSVRNRPFYGLIDEVALFDKALTVEQIRAHFQAQLKETAGFQYAVKSVCGKSKGVVVAPGEYFTAINVHNPNEKGINFKWKFATALPGKQRGQVSKFSDVMLEPDQAFEIDCPDIFQRAESKDGFVKGFVVIESDLELDVVAVYTAAGATSRVETMELERVKPRRQGAESKPSPTCAEFSTRPANTIAGSMFTQTGFTFKQLGPQTPEMSFKEEAGEIGLNFFDAGLEITLPAPSKDVTMRIGTFGGVVKLTAYDGAASVYTQTINTANTYQNFTINTPAPFTRLVLKGGNNEAILVRICTD